MNTAIEKLIEKRVSEGNLEEAMIVARSINRSLTQKEIEKIVSYRAKYFWHAPLESTLQRLNLSEEFIDDLIVKELSKKHILFESCDTKKVLIFAKYKCSDEIMKKIIDCFTNDYDNAQELCSLLTKISASNEIIDYFLEKIYQNNHWDISLVSRLISRSSKKLQERIILHVVSEGFLKRSLDIANSIKRKLTPDELEKIKEKNIKNGWHENVEEICKITNSQLTEKEIYKLVESRIETGYIKGLREVTLKWLHREPTKKEIRSLIEKNIKSGDVFEIKNIKKFTGKELGKKDTDELIKSLISKNEPNRAVDFIKESTTRPSPAVLNRLIKSNRCFSFSTITYLANLAGRELTQEEISGIF